MALYNSDAKTAPHNSSRGSEIDLMGATLVLLESKLVNIHMINLEMKLIIIVTITRQKE